jgi:3-hydroxyisobutyrate dehydrogenase
MGSSDPSSTVALAGRLRARGIRFIDAPVSGGPSKAESGELTIMIGGAQEDIETANLLLRHLGTTLITTGSVGSGHAMKALNNMLSAIGLVGALEVLAAGAKFGLDPRVMLSVINSSTGRNQSTEAKIAQQIFSGDYNVGFSLELTVKDIATALRLANAGGTDMRVGAMTVDVCRDALELLRQTNPDQSEIAKFISERAGVSFDSSSPRPSR